MQNVPSTTGPQKATASGGFGAAPATQKSDGALEQVPGSKQSPVKPGVRKDPTVSAMSLIAAGWTSIAVNNSCCAATGEQTGASRHNSPATMILVRMGRLLRRRGFGVGAERSSCPPRSVFGSRCIAIQMVVHVAAAQEKTVPAAAGVEVDPDDIAPRVDPGSERADGAGEIEQGELARLPALALAQEERVQLRSRTGLGGTVRPHKKLSTSHSRVGRRVHSATSVPHVCSFSPAADATVGCAGVPCRAGPPP